MNFENLGQLITRGKLAEAAESVGRLEGKGSAEDHFALFCICLLLGDLDRAERALGFISSSDREVPDAVKVYAGLLNAERTRQQWRASAGNRPSAFADPPSYILLQCKAWHEFLHGEKEKAIGYLNAALERRPSVEGEIRTHDGERIRFDDLGDADTFSEGALEVLTPDRFFLVPFADLVSIEMDVPENLFEAVLLPARIRTKSKLDGMVWVPVLYAGSHLDDSGPVRTGNSTKWKWLAEGVACGVGQRVMRVLNCNSEEDDAGIEFPWKIVRAIRVEKVLY